MQLEFADLALKGASRPYVLLDLLSLDLDLAAELFNHSFHLGGSCRIFLNFQTDTLLKITDFLLTISFILYLILMRHDL